MHVFDSFDDKALIQKLLDGMYAELPEKKVEGKNCIFFIPQK